jgi:hypothetical protein
MSNVNATFHLQYDAYRDERLQEQYKEDHVCSFLSNILIILSRVSPNFCLKRKEAKRKQKKRKRNSEKKLFVSLHFATKQKSLLYAKTNRIGSEKIFKNEKTSKIKIKIYTEQEIFHFDKK